MQVITDSASALLSGGFDIPTSLHVIAMSAMLDNTEYIDSQVSEFNAVLAARLKNPPRITTSQPSPAYIHAVFEECLRTGEDVIAIMMSSKMSGTYDSCCLAASMLAGEYPDQKIAVIDSTSNSLDEGLAVLAALEAVDKGGDIEEAVGATLDSIARSRWLFTVETFDYLLAGGRVGAASAFAANLLKICPVLTVRNGETAVEGKTRLYAKARKFVSQKCLKDIEEYGLDRVYVQYAGDKVAADRWSRELSEELGCTIPCLPIAPAVGGHVGNAMGIVYRCADSLAGKVDEVKSLVEKYNF